MTWGEFKEAVEEGGVTDEMKIWFIDIHLPDTVDVSPTTEHRPQDLGVTVTS